MAIRDFGGGWISEDALPCGKRRSLLNTRGQPRGVSGGSVRSQAHRQAHTLFAEADEDQAAFKETRAKRGLSGRVHIRIPSFERFAELIVQGLGPDLQQKVSPPIRPAQLLLFHEPLTDHLVDGRLEES